MRRLKTRGLKGSSKSSGGSSTSGSSRSQRSTTSASSVRRAQPPSTGPPAKQTGLPQTATPSKLPRVAAGAVSVGSHRNHPLSAAGRSTGVTPSAQPSAVVPYVSPSPKPTPKSAATAGKEATAGPVQEPEAHDGDSPVPKAPRRRSLWTRVGQTIGVLSASTAAGNTNRIILTLVVVLFIGLLLLAVPFALVETKAKPNATNETAVYSVCATPDCLRHTFVLGMNRTRYLDPCDDFSLFVCSAWIRAETDVSLRVAGQAAVKWLWGMSSLSAKQSANATWDDKQIDSRARQLMTLCLDGRPDSDEAGVRAFKEVLRSGDLAFLSPQKYGDDPSFARLIRSLVLLSGKWLVPLWFRVDMLPFRSAGNAPIFVLSPEPLVLGSRTLHRVTSASRQTYALYVEAFVHVFYDNDSAVTTDYLKFLRQKSVSVQAVTLNSLSGAVLARDWTAVHGNLTDLEKFLPKLSAADWAAALREAYRGTVEGGRLITITEGDAVHARSRVHLEAMGNVMAQVPALDLLHQTAWSFAQVIGSLTSNAIFDAFGRYEIGRTVQVVACAVQASLTYNVMLAAANFASLSNAERDTIVRSLYLVRSITAQKLGTGPKLRDDVRNVLVKELVDMLAVLWPTTTYTQQEGLDRIYGDAPDNSRGFFGHWLSSRKHLQRSLINLHKRAVVGRIYLPDTTQLTPYNPALGLVEVSSGALQSPFYYRDGTAAMLYGGLGFLLAQSLLNGADAVAQIKDATENHSPLAKESARLAQAASCPDSNIDKGTLFPYLPALEAAHAAFVELTANSTDVRLSGMERYTGEQVFFLTMCHILCEEDGRGSSWSPACNAAARHFEPFARAFSCPGGSSMNPANKCHFLNA